MLINTSSEVNRATYYKLKKDFTYTTKSRYGKDIEKTGLAFTKWNGEQEEFVATSIGGHIGNITLAEEKTVKSKKDGKSYIIQELFLEIHSYNDQKQLQRGVVSMPFSSKYTKAIISKLVMCSQYGNVHIEVGQFKTDEGAVKDFVTVWDGTPYLDQLQGVDSLFITQEQYRKNDKQIVLPARVYLKQEGKQYVETTSYEEAAEGPNGKMIAPSYDQEIKTMYAALVEQIKSKLTPLEPFVGPDKPDNNHTEEVSGVVYSDELPNVDVDEIKVDMPF